MTRRCAGSLWVVEWGDTSDHSLAGRPRPVSRPDLDGGARLRRTHLENPPCVEEWRGVAGVVEIRPDAPASRGGIFRDGKGGRGPARRRRRPGCTEWIRPDAPARCDGVLHDNRQVVFDDDGWRLKTDPAEHLDPAQSDSLVELHRWLDARSRSIRLADLLIEVRKRPRVQRSPSPARGRLPACSTRSPSPSSSSSPPAASTVIRPKSIVKAIRDGGEQGDHVTSDQSNGWPRGGVGPR